MACYEKCLNKSDICKDEDPSDETRLRCSNNLLICNLACRPTSSEIP